MFNYRCIKVGKKGDSFIPYVTGFNFAKVEDQSNPVATVIAYASNARDKGKADQKSAKYIPGEWEYASEIGTEMDWEKVDVYSLGVFLCDMLSGRIHDHLLSEQEMKGLIPDPLISLILRMVSEDIYERPSCRDALQEMEQCQ